MTTTAQQAALEKAVVRVVYFCEFAFKGGTGRFNTTNQLITWNGQEWLGVGTLGGISAVEESDSLEARALNFTLNAAQPSWLALAAGPVEEYRGRSAKLYMCPLNESFQMIDTPVLCWVGYMDMVSIGVEGDAGQIVLKCESRAYGLKRRPALRLNHAQHQTRHPGDKGLEFLEGLISHPQVWVTKRFQQK